MIPDDLKTRVFALLFFLVSHRLVRVDWVCCLWVLWICCRRIARPDHRRFSLLDYNQDVTQTSSVLTFFTQLEVSPVKRNTVQVFL